MKCFSDYDLTPEVNKTFEVIKIFVVWRYYGVILEQYIIEGYKWIVELVIIWINKIWYAAEPTNQPTNHLTNKYNF